MRVRMDLAVDIDFVADKGDPTRERLVLRVRRNADIGDFVLIRTGFEDNQVTTEVINTFWFPYKPVNRGDIVVVYSKRGNTKHKELRDNRTAYFFYWGQDSALWDDDNVAPVLLYAPDWVGKAPRELIA